MKILIGADVFGWKMTGLLGAGAAWFFGFSVRPLDSVQTQPKAAMCAAVPE